MAIGLTEEHAALAESVRAFTERHLPPEVVRAGLEKPEERPAYWPALAAQGLLGLHLPEEHGGQGFSLVELAIAVEQFGRTPAGGPYVPTVLASAVIGSAGNPPAGLLAELADGSRTAAVALAGGLTGRRTAQGLAVTGTVEPVLGATLADVLVVPVDTGEATEWVVLDAAETQITPLESLDLTRGVAAVSATDAVIPAERVLRGVADPYRLAAVVLGAEACGIAGWALDAAASYAKLRKQFGRPIGQFQGVKHLCAWMLVGVERARATVWDAARALAQDRTQWVYAAAVAAAVAPDAAVRNAADCIQVHGGIGYTWEHDAHLYYRRALTLRALLGRASACHDTVGGLAVDGVRPALDLELPPDARGVGPKGRGAGKIRRVGPEGSGAGGNEPIRTAIRSRAEQLAAMDLPAQRAAMAAEGWVTPHLPRPWGRAAPPVEQVVIQQELRRAGVRPVPLMIGAWVVPSLVQYGTPEQQERFLPPTLRGELLWCQLFSEPGAGSDLAGLSTKAERVEGGWRITGQKIWTSLAREAQWGICIARTDPGAAKHEGITYFLVDMASAGIEVRPLRECTGDAVFNEVFLDGVFVPDAMVVGPVDQGWRVARNTLANERVGLTSSFQLGGDVPQLVELAAELGLAADPVVRAGIGRLACDEHALQLLGLRATLKQLSGTDPGATANVRKLIAMEHGQDVTEYGMDLLGPAAALWPAAARDRADLRRRWTHYALACRAMTIGGGTTQINLNVIAERILGLPRDP
jgi:alkylation response protein AidB-like acyl-CoA dehydrogenase